MDSLQCLQRVYKPIRHTSLPHVLECCDNCQIALLRALVNGIDDAGKLCPFFASKDSITLQLASLYR